MARKPKKRPRGRPRVADPANHYVPVLLNSAELTALDAHRRRKPPVKPRSRSSVIREALRRFLGL